MKIAFLKLVAISAVVISALAPVNTSAAGSASLTLGASATQVANGSSVSVSVFENGTDVNVVTAKLTYDVSKFSCGAVSVSGAFPNKASASCGGGSVTMSHYTNPGTVAPAGSLVGTVTFTAMSDAGSAVVSTAAGSQVASAGANMWNGALSKVTISLTAVANAVTPPGRGSVAQPTQPVTATPSTTKKTVATTSTTNNATGTDTTAAEAPKATEAQVAAATDNKPLSESQVVAPVAEPASKMPVYIGVAVLAAAAVAFAFRAKLSAVLAKAKEA